MRELKAKGVTFEHYDMPGMTARGRRPRRRRHEGRVVQGPGRQHPQHRQQIVLIDGNERDRARQRAAASATSRRSWSSLAPRLHPHAAWPRNRRTCAMRSSGLATSRRSRSSRASSMLNLTPSSVRSSRPTRESSPSSVSATEIDHRGSYEQFDECMESGEVDAVYIALPNHLHAEYTIRAAKHGVHVLCEKPMAVTEKDCRAMIRACGDDVRRLMIAYRLHFEKANLCHDPDSCSRERSASRVSSTRSSRWMCARATSACGRRPAAGRSTTSASIASTPRAISSATSRSRSLAASAQARRGTLRRGGGDVQRDAAVPGRPLRELRLQFRRIGHRRVSRGGHERQRAPRAGLTNTRWS